MKPTERLRLSLLLVVLSHVIFPRIARGQTEIARSAIAPSGSTVLGARSPKGRENIVINTAKLDSTCAGSSPVGWMIREYKLKELVIISDLRVSIDGKPIVVPPSVYALLSNPVEATLQFEKGGF